jgi:hypothetical protein
LKIVDTAVLKNFLAMAMQKCPVVYGRTCARCVKHQGELWCLADVENVRPIENMVRYKRTEIMDRVVVKIVPAVEPPKGCPHADKGGYAMEVKG